MLYQKARGPSREKVKHKDTGKETHLLPERERKISGCNTNVAREQLVEQAKDTGECVGPCEPLQGV